MSYVQFGLRLKLIRRFHKLTQNDISKQLNISRQAYSNYEQGRCLPPPDTLAKISILLNTNLFSYFLENNLQSELSNHIKNQSKIMKFSKPSKSKKERNEMTNKDFGMVLAEKRIAAGYTQSKAADLLYLARSTYNHYESGIRIPSTEILIQMSILFKVDPMDLLSPLIPAEAMNEFPLYSKIMSKNNLSSNEKKIIAHYRCLDEEEQLAVLNITALLNKTHSEVS